jgi:hypothetical protein
VRRRSIVRTVAGFHADDLDLAAEALREKAERGGDGAERAKALAATFTEAAARSREREQPAARQSRFLGRRFGVLVLWLTIGALVVSALISIVGLLTGEFSEGEGRVLLAVVSVWIFSLSFLAGVRAIDRGGTAAWVGRAAQVLAVAGLGFSLGLIIAWHHVHEDVGRAYWALEDVALYAAHSAYLLGWDTRQDKAIRAVLAGTLLASGVLAAMLMSIACGYDNPSGGFWRVLGVFAILTVLGDLVLPVLSRLRLSAARPAH